MHDARAGLDNAGWRTAHDSQLQVSGFMGNDRQMGGQPKALIRSGLLLGDEEWGLTYRVAAARVSKGEIWFSNLRGACLCEYVSSCPIPPRRETS